LIVLRELQFSDRLSITCWWDLHGLISTSGPYNLQRWGTMVVLVTKTSQTDEKK